MGQRQENGCCRRKLPFKLGNAPSRKEEAIVHKPVPVPTKKPIPQTPKPTAVTGIYKWRVATDHGDQYKNDFLEKYQRSLIAAGIKDDTLIKLLLAQKIQEDGMFKVDRIGDQGCSIGYFQYNKCVNGNKGASFLTDDAQIDWMIGQIKARIDLYGATSYYKIIQAHNCPACASGKRPYNGYVEDVKRHLGQLYL